MNPYNMISLDETDKLDSFNNLSSARICQFLLFSVMSFSSF
jgi:hypothetical protein